MVAAPKDRQWVVLERAWTLHVDEKEKPGWVYVLNKGLNTTLDGLIASVFGFIELHMCMLCTVYYNYDLARKEQSVDTYREKKILGAININYLAQTSAVVVCL